MAARKWRIAEWAVSPVYIVKLGGLYADGSRGWARKQQDAFKFTASIARAARRWALEHAGTFKGARIVRLHPRPVVEG